MISPRSMAPQYCGMRMTPWESWPARFAATSDPARILAKSGGVPAACAMSTVSDRKTSATNVGINHLVLALGQKVNQDPA